MVREAELRVFEGNRDYWCQNNDFPLFYTLYEEDKQKHLISRINKYLEKSSDQYILVGHSFGGIIAYSLSENAYKRINKIITIASPHRVPFKWFKRIINKIPYKQSVNVEEQLSYGFLFDTTVPFIFTKHNSSKKHKNLLGEHNLILNNFEFITKIL